MSHPWSRSGVFSDGVAVGLALALVFFLGTVTTPVWAEDFPGLTNPNSPFIFPPLFRAEITAAPIWESLSSGKLSSTEAGRSWDLKDSLHFDQSAVFVDFMARLQTGRFSIRAYYEPRKFSSQRHFQDDADAPRITARFTYPGVRVGGDIDVAQWQLSRIGVNMDYDVLAPSFTEESDTGGEFKMTGSGALTIGIHGVYNPTANYCGITPIFQFRARWPVSGAELTDAMVAGGLRTPETVLGSMAWMSGYRHTVLEFGTKGRNFDITLDGWFSELAYYY